MTSFDALTQDDFLGGKLRIWQPAKGYRAGVDPVLLAAATPVRAGQSVLELGCGVGTAALCLHARVPGLRLTGVELQACYASLAEKNAAENRAAMEVTIADLRGLPETLKATEFDHVIANPPYYQRDRSTSARDTGRDIALGGDTDLQDWIDVATRRLRPKGYLTFIQRADRLPDILAGMDERLGSVRVRPIAPRVGRAAELVIVQARKGGRAAFVLEAPLVMHAGVLHTQDAESYTPEVLTILREGGALPWGR